MTEILFTEGTVVLATHQAAGTIEFKAGRED
jgi:hypothetical protein